MKLDFLLSKKFALFSQNVNKLSRILRDVFAKYLSKTGWERHPVFSWGSFNCLQHCAALHFRNFFSSLKTSSLQYSISHHRKIKIVWRDIETGNKRKNESNAHKLIQALQGSQL